MFSWPSRSVTHDKYSSFNGLSITDDNNCFGCNIPLSPSRATQGPDRTFATACVLFVCVCLSLQSNLCQPLPKTAIPSFILRETRDSATRWALMSVRSILYHPANQSADLFYDVITEARGKEERRKGRQTREGTR